ncbi:hypothetical protein D3C87_1257530 [compost metagenome]
MVLVERPAVVVHQRVLFPGFRDHHHHRVDERVAGHRQQFEAVVERCRIGLARIDQRPQLGQVVAEHRRRNGARARVDPVDVALDRVDFAVVGDHAVRVGQFPGREGVGGEALVHQGQGRDGARVLQVEVVLAHLVGQQQALVHHGTGRHRRHEVFLAVLELERLDGVAGGLADDVELTFQRVRGHDVAATANEDLADHRLGGAHRGGHRHVAVHRHVTPAQHDLAFQAHRALELLLAGQARGVFLRQEDHAHAVLAVRRQGHALLGHFLAVELVRDLDQDAGAVAHQLVGAHGAAMVEVLEDLQALRDDLVRLAALDVRNHADAAGVVLVGRVIEALRLRAGGGIDGIGGVLRVVHGLNSGEGSARGKADRTGWLDAGASLTGGWQAAGPQRRTRA